MQLINAPNNKYRDANASTLDAGTPIPAACMNTLQDELANVVTGYGLTLDSTNDGQVKSALDGHFAPIASPTLTGTPLTSQPGSSAPANQIATVDYVNQKAMSATVGFTPVQEGGGTGMGTNKVYIGWASDASGVIVQVDASSMGKLVFQQNDSSTDGVSKIGYNTSLNQFAYFNNVTSDWKYIYSTTDIDSKNYISSIVSGNNSVVSNLIWNTSSSLPAITYNSGNDTSYLATTDWVNNDFVSNDTWNNNINQDVRTSASPTFQDVFLKTLTFNNGGNSSIYQDTNNGDVVIHTNNGSDHFNVFNSDGSVNFGSNQLSIGTIVASGDIHTGDGKWLYTSTIEPITNGTVNINGTILQQGSSVATQSWVTSQDYVPSSTYSSDFGSSGNIINLAYGHRINTFTVTITSGTRINYPQAFSANATSINMNSTIRLDLWVESQDSSGFTVLSNENTSQTIFVCAIGPK